MKLYPTVINYYYNNAYVDEQLAWTQPTITSTTSLSLASIATTGTITASKFISNFLEPPMSGGSFLHKG
ncbi:MAG: hypothetical protein ACKPKO_46135 [Candidatus Fonsibacter sp.]